MNKMSDAPRDVRITTNGVQAEVTVGGIDMSDALIGYQLEHRANQVPFLALLAKPGADGVAFDGLAQVALASETPPREAIAAFLRSINPIQLEQTALERDDLADERYGLARAMLAQLTDWALEGEA